jgi:tetratricopeptide (TPR) repeat protein
VKRAAVAALLLVANLAGAAESEAGREHFDRGTRLYDMADFAGAIDEFQQAYEISAQPVLLFNIAQCHRQLGEVREAAHVYEMYLRLEPNAANRHDVEERLAELAPKLRALDAARVKPVVRDAPPRLQRIESRSALRGLGVTALSLGAVALITGAALSARAADDERQLHGAMPGATWTPQDQALFDDGSHSNTGAAAAYATGAAFLAVGVVACALGWRKLPAPRLAWNF